MKKPIIIFTILFISFHTFSQQAAIVKVPLATVEKSPLIQGCENDQNSEGKKCTLNKVTSLLMSNFNENLLTYRDRSFAITFTVNPDGAVTDAATFKTHAHLQPEAERVISLLPKFQPGEHRNKKVPVHFAVKMDYSSRWKEIRKRIDKNKKS